MLRNGILKKVKKVLDDSKKNKIDKYIEESNTLVKYEYEKDYDGSKYSVAIGPWENEYSEMFICQILHSKLTSVAFIETLARLEEELKTGKNDKAKSIGEKLLDVSVDKIISLAKLPENDIRSMLQNADKQEIIRLQSNVKRLFPTALSVAPHMGKVYVVTVAIDSLAGRLPDMLSSKEIDEEYTVEKARRLLNEFPVGAGSSGSVEARSINMIIASYLFAVLENLEYYNVLGSVVNMMGYKEFKDIDPREAARKSGIDISNVQSYDVANYEKKNKTVSSLFAIIRREIQVNYGEGEFGAWKSQVLKNIIVQSRGSTNSRSGLHVSSTENNKSYNIQIRRGRIEVVRA